MRIRPKLSHGKQKFEVDLGLVDGVRRRLLVDTEPEARRLLRDAKSDKRAIGNQWAALPAATRSSIVKILGEMQQEGVTFEQVWAAYRDGRAAKVVSTMPIGTAIQRWRIAKEAANKRPKYISLVASDLSHFARGRDQMAVSSFRRGDIEEWLAAKRHLSAETRRVLLIRLRVFFQFCVDHDWALANPADAIDDIKVEWKPKRILKPNEARKLMDQCFKHTPDYLWNVVLGLYCGIRSEELDRLTVENVDLNTGMVTIDASVSKVRRRRVVKIPECAMGWLKLHPGLGWSESFTRRLRRKLRLQMGWSDWPQNILRHTAASYMMAKIQDAGKVSYLLGDSPKILMERYHQLVSASDMEDFYQIETGT